MIFSISHPFPSQKRKFSCASEWVGRTDYFVVPPIDLGELLPFWLSALIDSNVASLNETVFVPLNGTFVADILLGLALVTETVVAFSSLPA